jgi:hypothetical protein
MKNSKYVMWFAKNKNVTMLHNLSRNWPVMMEASSLHVTWIKKSFYFPQEKDEVDDVNKASETVYFLFPSACLSLCLLLFIL